MVDINSNKPPKIWEFFPFRYLKYVLENLSIQNPIIWTGCTRNDGSPIKKSKKIEPTTKTSISILAN